MALETRIPKEINDYREKIVAGLSARQLASLSIAAAVVCISAFILWYLLGIPFAIVEYILILEAIPFTAYGFIRHKGMPFEEVALIRWNFRFDEKRLLNKTSLDYLPSLYPLRREGVSCLCAQPTRGKRRPRAQTKEQAAAQGREAAQERAT